MTIIYATKGQMAIWMTGNPNADASAAPANAEVLLRSASMLVREATNRATYKVVDATGLPVAADLLAAFADATCSLATAYSKLGIDPLSGSAGFDREISSKALGAAQVAYATDNERNISRARLADGRTLNMECYLILKQAGLISLAVTSDRFLDVWAPGPWPVS